jgi:ribose transport system ATP-binding protein
MRELGYDFDVARPVGELAAAERTGVAIARALARTEDACLLVVDEPTAMLPRHEVEILFEAIRRITERGVGVIYVSHRLDEVFAIADQVTVLRDGRRVGTFPVQALDEHRLVELMMGSAPHESQRVQRADGRTTGLLTVRGLDGRAVNNVSFDVDGGEVVGVGGLTGSGREELLPLLFGAYRRGGGAVEVAGEALPAGSPSAAIAAGVALVPGDRHGAGSIMSLLVRENLVLTDPRRHAGRFWKLRRNRERAEAQHWTTSLEIRPRDPDVPFTSLSGGNQQKVVLAKWLRMQPRVLLLDEPAQGVDVGAKAIIHDLARQAAAGGAAVLIASSEDAELCDCCDRVLVIRDGRVAGMLEGDEINSHALARLQLAAAA